MNENPRDHPHTRHPTKDTVLTGMATQSKTVHMFHDPHEFLGSSSKEHDMGTKSTTQLIDVNTCE